MADPYDDLRAETRAAFARAREAVYGYGDAILKEADRQSRLAQLRSDTGAKRTEIDMARFPALRERTGR